MRRILPFGLAMALAGIARAEDVKIPLGIVQAGVKKAECSIELKDEEREVVGALGNGWCSSRSIAGERPIRPVRSFSSSIRKRRKRRGLRNFRHGPERARRRT